jgi:hypothetical protein
MDDDEEITWEWTTEAGVVRKRLGRSKTTGVVLSEITCDSSGREIETIFYSDDGTLAKQVTYEYDNDRRPKLVQAYDRNEKLVWRQERGKRPEQL